jgi:nicotinamide-nucleotide amidase
MIIEILSIGDEILSGNITNTNAQYLSDECWRRGFQVKYHTTVGDHDDDVRDALLRASERADAILCTGGLGPTMDDFTIEVAAKTFGVPLVIDEATEKFLEAWCAKRGRKLTDNNRKQALIPQGGKALSNKAGTAPGVFYEFRGKPFYFMPGVPTEMRYLFKTHIQDNLKSRQKDAVHFETVLLKTFGCPESELDNKLKDLEDGRSSIQNARIGFRVAFPDIYLKISTWDVDTEKSKASLSHVVDLVKERVGEFIYTENESESLEDVVVAKLLAAQKTVAVAESCTGGLVASRLTSVPGVSEIFLGGFVTYSNELKTKILGVNESLLKTHGAVSAECAEAMVRGVYEKTGAQYCASVTGIAGPTGGSPEKPVGTVHVATLCDGVLENKKYLYPLPRDMFRQLVSSIVLKRFLMSLSSS